MTIDTTEDNPDDYRLHVGDLIEMQDRLYQVTGFYLNSVPKLVEILPPSKTIEDY